MGRTIDTQSTVNIYTYMYIMKKNFKKKVEFVMIKEIVEDP